MSQDIVKSIAKQRVHTLFSLASETIKESPALAQEYADSARKIAMAAKIRLPTKYRAQVCRHCKAFLMPGVNSRTRIRQSRQPHIVTTCLNCGGHMRRPLTKRRLGGTTR